MDSLFGGHFRHRIRLLSAGIHGFGGFPVRDITGESIGTAVENQVVRQRPLFGFDFSIRRDVRRIHDGHIQAGFYGMVQKHAVQHGARRRTDAERQVADPQHGECARQFGLDAAYGVQVLDRRIRQVLLARDEREDLHIEYQRVRWKPVLADDDFVQAFRNTELGVGGFGHAVLIDGHGDNGRAVVRNDRQPLVHAFGPVFQVDGVDDRAPRTRFQRGFHHIELGGVDDERGFNAHAEAFHKGSHLRGFVGAFGHCDADVQHVSAALHLLPSDLQTALIVICQQKAFDFPASHGVHAFADEERRRFLPHVHPPHTR